MFPSRPPGKFLHWLADVDYVVENYRNIDSIRAAVAAVIATSSTMSSKTPVQ